MALSGFQCTLEFPLIRSRCSRSAVFCTHKCGETSDGLGLLFNFKPQLAAVVSALSLGVGILLCGHKAFAYPSSPVENLRAENINPSSDAEELEQQRAFDSWKSAPYALTVPLRIVGLRGSVPPIWLKEFTLSQGRRVKLSAEFQGSLNAIYTALSSAVDSGQVSAQSPLAADVVTIGDSWLAAAIRKGIIVPVGKPEQLDWFDNLHPRWKEILKRDESGRPSDTGNVWGAPYRCGCMMIAYRKDKLMQSGVKSLTDWDDLWQPKLEGKISMVNSTREVIGLVLKSMGASYNTGDMESEVPGGKQAVKEKFLKLRKQVRVFDDLNYLKALGAGEVWIAVGWSMDVIAFAKRSSNIAVIAPSSGTSLWADIWAIPAATAVGENEKMGGRVRGPSPLVLQWMDFCMQPARSLNFVEGSACPLSLENMELVGDPHVVGKSEFLEPLSPQAISDYNWILQ